MHTGLPAPGQDPEERATGGQIARPGADVNDTVPAILSPGFVLLPDAAREAFSDELIEEINEPGHVPPGLRDRVSKHAIVEPGLVDDTAGTGRTFMWDDSERDGAEPAVLPDSWQSIPEPARGTQLVNELLAVLAAALSDGPLEFTEEELAWAAQCEIVTSQPEAGLWRFELRGPGPADPPPPPTYGELLRGTITTDGVQPRPGPSWDVFSANPLLIRRSPR